MLDSLLKSAKTLKQPSAEAAAEFKEKNQIIAELLIKKLNKHPNLESFIGEGNKPLMETNSHNFCLFMSSILVAYDPKMFAETCVWAFRAYRSHGFQVTYWAVYLDIMLTLVHQECSEKTYKEINPFFEWILTNIPNFTLVSDEQLSQDPTEH
jgi:hypothetical protein